MSVRALWDDEDKTIIRYDFDITWTWDEFLAATAEGFAMTCSVTCIVDTISNFAPGMTLPANALFYFRRAMTSAPQNRGITVVVTSSSIIRTMVTTFSHFNKQIGERLLVAETLDEARAIIRKRRS